jgi:predicted nucleic acid-binding protein
LPANPKSKKLKVYWDTSVILAWVKDEVREAGQMENLYSVAERIMANEILMFTSAAMNSEIYESSLTESQLTKLEAVFDRTNTAIVNIDVRVGKLTAQIREFFRDESRRDGRPPICFADAQHLAAAIAYGADEFHTFDHKDKDSEREKCRALVGIGNNVAGYPLLVTFPKNEQIGLI